MKCDEYIFQLSSGQLARAGALPRLAAKAHVLMCVHCRRYTANDRHLSQVVQTWHQRVSAQDPPAGDAP